MLQNKKIIEDGTTDRDIFDTEVMGKFTPFPREVINTFKNLSDENIKSATDYFYNFSNKTNYIRTERIEKKSILEKSNRIWRFRNYYKSI